jgi:hypothetical protein
MNRGGHRGSPDNLLISLDIEHGEPPFSDEEKEKRDRERRKIGFTRGSMSILCLKSTSYKLPH